MDVEVDPAALLDALVTARRTVTAGAEQNTLAVKLEADTGGMTIETGGRDFFLRSQGVGATVSPGISIVRHHPLHGFVSSAAGPIRLGSDGTRLSMTTPGAEAHIRTMSNSDWPKRKPATGAWTAWDGNVVASVGAVTHAAATADSSKRALTGVAIEGNMVVATDSYRLAAAELPDAVGESLIVPASAVRLVSASSADGCSIRFDSRRIEFDTRAGTYSAQLIEGDYPDWRAAIPKSLPFRIRVSSAALRAAIDATLLFANPDTSELQLAATATTLTLAASHTEIGDSTRTLDAHANSHTEIRVNGRFLAEAIRSTSSEDLLLQLNDDGSRIVIHDQQLYQMVSTIKPR